MSSIKALTRTSTACALALTALLGACATKPPTADQGVRSTDQFPVRATTTPTGIRLAAHKDGLTSNQTDALRGLASDWRKAGDGMIVVEIPSCACDDGAITGYDAYDALISMGVPERSIRLLGYDADPGGPVRVSFQKVAAKTYDCDASWGDLTKTGDNKPVANFGCTVNSNIAAMIDRPSDILRPRDADPANGQRREADLDKYRQGKASSADKEPDTDLSISGTAK